MKALPSRTSISLLLRLALRELRASIREGLHGFRILLACLTLGVAAIAGVGSVSSLLTEGLAENGQEILGGDIAIRINQREANAEELAYITRDNELSRLVTMRAMARNAQGDAQRLIELKAVDNVYPLYGTMRLQPSMPLEAALARRETAQGARYGVAVEPALAARLGIKLGDELRIGEARLELRAMIVEEPDRLGDGFALGPRAMIGFDALGQTALVQPGSLTRYEYLLRRPASLRDGDALKTYAEDLKTRFPHSGWQVRDRSDSAPGLRRFVDQAALFLTFVGLTTLAVGGVGIGTAVSVYLDRKKNIIAILKSLGAASGDIFLLYFLLIMALSLAGTLIGLALGASLPFLLSPLLSDLVPVPAEAGLYPGPLLLAASYGLITAAAFALYPLGRTKNMRAASIFRDLVESGGEGAGRPFTLAAGLLFLLLAALAVLVAQRPNLAIWFVSGIAVAFVLLRFAALGVMKAASRIRPRSPESRLALANLYRPGAPTLAIMLSLGLGLTLLVTMASINGNLAREITGNLPERAPSFFFVDIQPAQLDAFNRLVQEYDSVTSIDRVPMLRGRIVAIQDKPVSEQAVPQEARWVLRGDRGITYAATAPADSPVVQGAWWPQDYRGPPLVSFDEKLAGLLGLNLGDRIVVNILGRDIEAKIANTRMIDWRNMGINFVMIFSPGVLEAAPHSVLATVALAEGDEESLEGAMVRDFPNVTSIRVKETLQGVNQLLGQFATGLNAAGGVSLLAGLLVLGGAVAADFRKRRREAALLKVLGATRWRIVGIYMREYAILGAATASIAAIAGSGLSFAVVTFIMDLQWTVLPMTLAATSLGATLLTLLFGVLSAWATLSAPSAASLRTE